MGEVHGFLAGGGLSGHLQVLAGVGQQAGGAPQEGVVVGEQNTDGQRDSWGQSAGESVRVGVEREGCDDVEATLGAGPARSSPPAEWARSRMLMRPYPPPAKGGGTVGSASLPWSPTNRHRAVRAVRDPVSDGPVRC